jgi:hypothetical protein
MKRERKSKRPLAPRKLPPECLCCGEVQPWVVNTVGFNSPFRGIEHTVSASVNQCCHCDAIFTTPEQLEAISLKVRDTHKTWVSKELKKVMKELNITIDGLVQKTGFARATVARASSGELLVEASTEKLLWHEIEELRRERIKQIWTTMVLRDVMHPRETIRIKVHTSYQHSAVNYAAVMKTTAYSPLAFPWQTSPKEPNPEQFAYACA